MPPSAPVAGLQPRVKFRPTTGWIPNVGKNVDSTAPHDTRTGFSSLRSQALTPDDDVKPVNAVCCLSTSSRSGRRETLHQ